MNALFDVETSKKPLPTSCRCGSCKLDKGCNHSFKDDISGKGKKKILVVSSFPEKCEDDAGKHFGGSDSRTTEFVEQLRLAFKMTDVDLKRDCWHTYAVNCAPRQYSLTNVQGNVDQCRPALMKTIKELKPTVILALGNGAVKALYGHRVHDMTLMIESWHGFVIPDHELNAWVIPCYGTATIAAQYTNSKEDGSLRKKDTQKTVIADIACAIRDADKHCALPVPDMFAKAKGLIRVMQDGERIPQALKQITDGDTISFDYETSGTKPDFEQHFIKCVSVYSRKLNVCFVFNIDTREEKYAKVRKAFKAILTNPNIKKVGQNNKHEERWSRAKLGVKVAGWVWDTMLSAHCLYNSRIGVTGLKFQSAVNFGVMDYNSTVEGAFHTTAALMNKGANALCAIDSINNDVLLNYCGLDSVFTYWLYLKQKKELASWKNVLKKGKTHIDGAQFLLKSILTFADMEERGTHIDTEYLTAKKVWCTEEIRKCLREFKKTELYSRWRDNFNPVKIGSGKQLGALLYDVMGLRQTKKTDSGEDSTDKEALLSLDLPDLAPYFRMKLLEKAQGTYIAQHERELHGNFLHPSFNLHVASTFRSSANDPNLQNIPIRNKDIGIVIRGAYTSRFGKNGMLIEADLKGAEVSVAACYNKDPKFISYVANPKNDMHKDTMALIMSSEPDNIPKDLRQIGKSSFVFPQFYGDWYKSCAEAIWADIQKLHMVDGTPALIQLQDKGILKLPKKWKDGDTIPRILEYKGDEPICTTAYLGFEKHLGTVEDHFWNDMFAVYTAWKEAWWKKYLRNGFVDSFTGFRYTGVMDKKKTINYPIQGDAYHLNQHGINIVNRELVKQEMQACVFNQIHDSGVYDSPNIEETREVIRMVNDTMNVRMRKLYPWINVPIVVEYQVSEPGGSWFHKKDFDLSTMDIKK